MTVDTTEALVTWRGHRLALIDAPGHLPLLRNMVSGVSRADAAVLVIDVVEGVTAQTLRHLAVAELLGCRSTVVALNKMDAVAGSEAAVAALTSELEPHLAAHGLGPARCVPLSGLTGNGVERHDGELAWFAAQGGRPLLELLTSPRASAGAGVRELRLPIQSVQRRGGDDWLLGTIASGELRVGQSVRAATSGAAFVVRRIMAYPSDVSGASSGDSIAIQIEGSSAAVTRGEVLVAAGQELKPRARVEARIVWLGKRSLEVGARLVLRCATQAAEATVATIAPLAATVADGTARGSSLSQGALATVELVLDSPVVLERERGSELGRIVLEQDGVLVSGGAVQ
jgi:sulfate adenylyltransferase subunit 1 (EFTu-like GTPase family)